MQIGLLLTTVVPTKAVWGQTVPPRKLDETLQDVVDRGCLGTQSVIIRTKPGYRQGMRESLTAHGDGVSAEFTSINAVAAEVHCDDLATLVSFDSTLSVSSNARVDALAVKKLAVKKTAKKTAQTLTRRQQAAAIALQKALRDEEGKHARAMVAPFFDTLGLTSMSTGTTTQTAWSLDLQTTLGVNAATGAGIGVPVCVLRHSRALP